MEYNATGSPKWEAAIAKMMMFKARIISLIVKLVLRQVYKASTSMPSTAQPARMVNPIPTPKKNPPKMETNNLSEVITGYGTYSRQSPSMTMQKKVLAANLLLME